MPCFTLVKDPVSWQLFLADPQENTTIFDDLYPYDEMVSFHTYNPRKIASRNKQPFIFLHITHIPDPAKRNASQHFKKESGCEQTTISQFQCYIRSLYARQIYTIISWQILMISVTIISSEH